MHKISMSFNSIKQCLCCQLWSAERNRLHSLISVKPRDPSTPLAVLYFASDIDSIDDDDDVADKLCLNDLVNNNDSISSFRVFRLDTDVIFGNCTTAVSISSA